MAKPRASKDAYKAAWGVVNDAGAWDAPVTEQLMTGVVEAVFDAVEFRSEELQMLYTALCSSSIPVDAQERAKRERLVSVLEYRLAQSRAL